MEDTNMKLNMELSDRRVANASRNLVGLRGTFIMCALLLAAYGLEIVKGDRTILSYMIFQSKYAFVILFF